MSTVPPEDPGLEAPGLEDPGLEDPGQEAPGQEAGLDPGPETEDASAAGDPGLAAERDRLARTLRDTRLQLAMTQARLSALEDSATLTLGRMLVRAARRPWSSGS